MGTRWGPPCSNRRVPTPPRRGGAARSWTRRTATSSWTRATSSSSAPRAQVTVSEQPPLKRSRPSRRLTAPPPSDCRRKDAAGADAGALFGRPLRHLRLHHAHPGRVRGRGHRVGHRQAAARCQLLRGQSTTRWAAAPQSQLARERHANTWLRLPTPAGNWLMRRVTFSPLLSGPSVCAQIGELPVLVCRYCFPG